MKWHLEVETGEAEFEVTHKDHLCLLGSCFASNISQKLEKSSFQVHSNPLGTVFNPLSLAFAMKDVGQEIRIGESQNGLHAMDAHGKFTFPTSEELRMKVDTAKKTFHQALLHSKMLIVTWGTAQVWEWSLDGEPVANCHKLPQAEFDSRFLEVDEITSCWENLLSRWFIANPDIQVVLTVSPVRYTRGGMANNSLSKGILHQASRKLEKQFKRVHYFPAYEMVIDELREYRFFKEDFIHPNDAAVRHVYAKFQQWCMSDETIEKSDKIQRLNQRLDHRFSSEVEAQKAREEVGRAIESLLNGC